MGQNKERIQKEICTDHRAKGDRSSLNGRPFRILQYLVSETKIEQVLNKNINTIL